MCKRLKTIKNLKFMKRINVILALCFASLLTSCGSTTSVLPKAINTVNAISLKELNLVNGDYQILNNVTAEATIVYSESKYGGFKIECPEEDFTIEYFAGLKGQMGYKASGIVKLGYLHNDHITSTGTYPHPEEIARRLAIYRLINMVKLEGADGVIEPVISTNIDNGEGKKKMKEVIFKTTVSAKLVKLNVRK